MRTSVETFIRVATMALFVAAADLAHGFYDPVVQRWINRDPIADPGVTPRLTQRPITYVRPARRRGEQNPHTFVKNAPVVNVDPEGLEILNYCQASNGKWTCKSPIENVVGAACLQEMQNVIELILGNWEIGGYPPANQDDSLQHCITSCRIARACGTSTAWALGQLKEFNDILHGGTANETDSDLEANQFGRRGVKCRDRSCEDYCTQNRSSYR